MKEQVKEEDRVIQKSRKRIGVNLKNNIHIKREWKFTKYSIYYHIKQLFV